MNRLIDLTGMRFGKLVVREKLPPNQDGRTKWLCDCDCGNSCVVSSYALRKKNQQSCGCGKVKNLVGQRFGCLVVLRRSDRYVMLSDKRRKYMWECECDCGATVHRLSEKLRLEKNCACKTCAGKSAVNIMVESAGYMEGTQLSKLVKKNVSTSNSSGVRGVYFNRKTGKWRATIQFKRKNHYLGEFTNVEDAIKARCRAEELYYAPMLEKYNL